MFLCLVTRDCSQFTLSISMVLASKPQARDIVIRPAVCGRVLRSDSRGSVGVLCLEVLAAMVAAIHGEGMLSRA